jgi:hypothetical protein
LVAGAIAALAILSIQSYSLIAGDGSAASGVHNVSATTDPSSNSTVSVSGSGEVNIQPSAAIITIGVTTQDPSAQTAAQENAVTMNNVIAALEAIGINQSSIQTTSYNIEPQTNYNGNSGLQTITGYQVTNEIQVTISVPSSSIGTLGTKVGQAIDAAAGQGANEISGIQFTASSTAIQQATNEALALAVQDAASQAKAVATALGDTLGSVVSVDANQGYQEPYVVDSLSGGTASTPVVAPQSLQVTASVQVVYSLN